MGTQIGTRQEDLPDDDGAGAKGLADSFDLCSKEILRDFDHDARAITGQAVGIDRATVGDGLQRLDGHVHHLTSRLAVDGADKADATGIALGVWIIGAGGDQLRAGGFVVFQPVWVRILAHAAASSVRARR